MREAKTESEQIREYLIALSDTTQDIQDVLPPSPYSMSSPQLRLASHLERIRSEIVQMQLLIRRSSHG